MNVGELKKNFYEISLHYLPFSDDAYLFAKFLLPLSIIILIEHTNDDHGVGYSKANSKPNRNYSQNNSRD